MLTLCALPWWSVLQPHCGIVASGILDPDELDGPCKLHRMPLLDVLSVLLSPAHVLQHTVESQSKYFNF